MYNESFSRQKQQALAILVIIVVIFLGYKLLFPYYTYSEFKVEIQKICNWDRENSMTPPPEDVFMERVIKASHKHGLSISQKNIHVKIKGPMVTISVKYTIPVDLIIKTFDWQFAFEGQTEEIF